jgi:glycerol-3-phosphate dehydrogenase (NAD(P)+)
MGEKIVVAGGGAFGTGLANVMSADQNADITLLMRNADHAADMQISRVNQSRLPNVKVPDGLKITSDMSCVEDADILLSVVPTGAQIEFAEKVRSHLKSSTPFVICSKGFDKKSGGLMSNSVRNLLPQHDVAVLSGPGFASDIAKGLPTAMALAAENLALAQNLSKALSRQTFRLYGSDDLVGVQTGGALKNVLAIASGIVMGAGLGESARASVIARGLAELSRYILFMGGKAETASGLSGLGDLVLTATSEQSRNYRFGIELGKGSSAESLVGPDKPLVEGANAAIAASAMSNRENIILPITNSVADIIQGRLDVAQAIQELLARPLRQEQE